MSTNLKFAIEIPTDTESLRSHLLDFSAYSKVTALNLINEGNAGALIDELKICAYDYRANVRTAAYYALRFCEADSITEVIKDSLRDEDKDAFKAARELYDFFNKK